MLWQINIDQTRSWPRQPPPIYRTRHFESIGVTLHWAMLTAAIVTSMGGQTLLKAGAGAPDFLRQLMDWRTLIGLFLYGGAALLYIVALRRIAMSVALPCTAVSYVAAALIGHYGFAEPLGGGQIGAIGLICAGVVLLALA